MKRPARKVDIPGENVMRFHRRQFLKFAGAAVAAPAISRAAWGQTPQVTLKLHHFLPPVSNGHSKLLAPWAKKVEADSGNRIKIDIFPSMQLGGTPPQLFDQARDGVADIVWTLPGSTPGRFPAHRGVRASVHRRQEGRAEREGGAGVLRGQSARRIQGSASDLPLGARRRARARQQAGQDHGRHEGPASCARRRGLPARR